MGKAWPAHESLHCRKPERALSKARHPIDTHSRKKNTQAGDGVVGNLSSRYFWEARGAAGSSPFLELISGMPAPLTHLEGAALQLVSAGGRGQSQGRMKLFTATVQLVPAPYRCRCSSFQGGRGGQRVTRP